MLKKGDKSDTFSHYLNVYFLVTRNCPQGEVTCNRIYII